MIILFPATSLNLFSSSSGFILNKYVIVMYQDAYLRYYIPINWKYNERWIVCLDFTSKDNLYGILCDGGIFKFNYFERKYKEKVTSNVLKLEGVVKAKFFEKGFIAYTQIHNFYIIKDFALKSKHKFFEFVIMQFKIIIICGKCLLTSLPMQ